jgi:uncharacterized protein (TIGR04255 family)
MDVAHSYNNAPITEAVIDLKVNPRSDVALADVEKIGDHERSKYPLCKPMKLALGQFSVGEEVSAVARSEQTGFAFTSSDGRQIFQSLKDGFTLSRLAPYESWEPFRDEARRLWSAYRASTRPHSVRRVAVRYINRIDLPTATADLKVYFRTSPEISPDLPQNLAGFFMRVALRLEDIKATALIQQGVMEPPQPGMVSIVLDIDLFRIDDVPQDDTEIWAYLEILRSQKNAIFEACITDPTRELFQ